MPNLSTKYMGLNLKNPLIAGSSGLTDSVNGLIALEKAGVAAVVLKSIFEEEIVSEMEINLKKIASERFLYPESLEYYEDNDEEDISIKYLDLIRDAKSQISIPVIASINCVTSDYWTYFPKQIELAGADAIELNIFILPSDLLRDRESTERVYFDIIEKVVKQVSIPVSIKVSYYFSDLAQILQKFSQTPIAGMVLFNKFYQPDFDINKLEVTSGKILSSPDDFHIPLRWISILSGRVNCSLAASTGVYDGESAIKQILAGANAIQIASTIYHNGFGQVQQMLGDIQLWMNSKGFESIDEFRGIMSQIVSDNPAAYERVQFMRYFRSYKGKHKP